MQEERYIPASKKGVMYLSTCGIRNMHTQANHLKPNTLILQLIEHCEDKSVILSDGLLESRFLVREKLREKLASFSKFDILKCGVIYFISSKSSTGSGSPTKEASLILSSVEQLYTGLKSKLGKPRGNESIGFRAGDTFGDIVIVGPEKVEPIPIPIPQEVTELFLEKKAHESAASTFASHETPVDRVNTFKVVPANNLKLQDTNYFTQINQLAKESKSWALKVRVTFKSKEIKSGTLRLFKVLLSDASGIIEMVFYNQHCEKYFDKIHLGQVLIVTAGLIKPATQYNMTGNSIEINFENKTEIAFCENLPHLSLHSQMPPEFSPYLESLKEAVDSKYTTKQLLTIIGIVVKISEKEELTLRDGRKEMKQQFTIIDEQKCKVEVFCWGKGMEKQDQIKVGDIIIFEHFKKAIYREGIQFSNGAPSRLIPDKSDYTTGKLYMLRKIRDELKVHDFQQLPADIEDLTSKNSQKTFKLTTVRELLAESDEYLKKSESEMSRKPSEQEPFFKTLVVQIKQFGSKFWYDSCGQNGCLRSVKDMGGYLECAKCGIPCDPAYKPVPRYMTNIEIADETGQTRTNIFDDKIGKEIFGLSIEELVRLKQVSDEMSVQSSPEYSPLNIHLGKRMEIFFKLTVTAKIEPYNGKSYSKLCVVKATDLSIAPLTGEVEQAVNRIILAKDSAELGKRAAPAEDTYQVGSDQTADMQQEGNKQSVYEMLNSPAKRLKTE